MRKHIWMFIVIALAALAGMANNASAATPKPGLDFSFTSAPIGAEISPGNIVNIMAVVTASGKKNRTGALIFPSWVHVKISNRHLVYDKIGNLVWNVPPLDPGHSATIQLAVIVTTAWGESACPAGSWHFGAKLYAPDQWGHLARSRELCYPPR